jgi:quinol monooxygenase YgiN
MYLFVERYTDWDAIENHRKSDHFRSLGKEMGAHMAGAPEIVRGEQI